LREERSEPPPLRESPQREAPNDSFEDAIAARLSETGGQIFKKLWRTAPPDEKGRMRSLFSTRAKHANLSGLRYVLEALDPQHRLEHFAGLSYAARAWLKEPTELYFFPWLEQSDNPVYKAPMGQVDYFDEKTRAHYALSLGSTIKSAKGNALEGDNIYAVSQSNQFYASGETKTDKGVVHHSSFLAGQAVKAAGHMVFETAGRLKSINLSSGHYRPKPEHMKNALRLLDRAQVDLSDVTAHPTVSEQGVNAKKWLDAQPK